MKVLVAPDSWGGFASAPEVARRVAEALEECGHEVVQLPMTDGGEGAALALRGLSRGASALAVTGPHGQDARPLALRLPGATFLESARVVGRRWCQDPLTASSIGLGEALRRLDATSDGPLVVGLGGSGTMDGGLGLARGLGLVLEGVEGAHPAAADLERVEALRGPPPLPGRLVQVWADVRTPLLESARVFGPQKGADELSIERVTRGLAHWQQVLAAWRRRHDLPELPAGRVFGGAAGGLAYALEALVGARVVSGAAAAARALELDRHVAEAEAVVTGEGRFDATSQQGKVVGEVLARAPEAWVFCGGSELERDRLVACDALPGIDREARFEAGLLELVRRLA